MKRLTLDHALDAARRFINSAERARTESTNLGKEFRGDQHTAAIRRNSMDLTRALADLRQNR